jgi:hypothetical protein
MLMLAAYFDDSGTHDDAKVVTWGGFIAPVEQWAAFDVAWRAKLASPMGGKPPLKCFHLSHAQALQPPFDCYTRTEMELLQNEFRQIIIDNRLMGLAYAVERKTWDRLAPDQARKLFGDAEIMCFSACFNGAIERAVKYWPNDLMLSLHFDLGRRSPKLDAIRDHVRSVYRGAPALINISFDAVDLMTPLQAADIIATENYWHANSVVDGNPHPRLHFKHFLERVSTEGYILQEAEIIATLHSSGFIPNPSSLGGG